MMCIIAIMPRRDNLRGFYEGILCIKSFSIYNDAIKSKEIIKLLTDY